MIRWNNTVVDWGACPDPFRACWSDTANSAALRSCSCLQSHRTGRATRPQCSGLWCHRVKSSGTQIQLTHYPSHTLSISHIIHLTHYPSHTLSISNIIHLTHYPSHTISISHNIHLTHYPSHTISISAQLVISAIGYKNIMQHLFSTHLQLYSSLCPVAMEQRLVPYHDWFGNIFFLTHRGRFACEAICMLRKSCSARDYMIWFALYFKDTTITVILVFISLDFIIHPAHILGIHSILVKFF